jgi:hypothetical protein
MICIQSIFVGFTGTLNLIRGLLIMASIFSIVFRLVLLLLGVSSGIVLFLCLVGLLLLFIVIAIFIVGLSSSWAIVLLKRGDMLVGFTKLVLESLVIDSKVMVVLGQATDLSVKVGVRMR